MHQMLTRPVDRLAVLCGALPAAADIGSSPWERWRPAGRFFFLLDVSTSRRPEYIESLPRPRWEWLVGGDKSTQQKDIAMAIHLAKNFQE